MGDTEPNVSPENWLADLDIDSVIQYADEYAKKVAMKAKIDAGAAIADGVNPFKQGLYGTYLFEDFLKEEHAEDYHGTDDDMPDAFEAWVERLTMDELVDYGEKYGQAIYERVTEPKK